MFRFLPLFIFLGLCSTTNGLASQMFACMEEGSQGFNTDLSPGAFTPKRFILKYDKALNRISAPDIYLDEKFVKWCTGDEENIACVDVLGQVIVNFSPKNLYFRRAQLGLPGQTNDVAYGNCVKF